MLRCSAQRSVLDHFRKVLTFCKWTFVTWNSVVTVSWRGRIWMKRSCHLLNQSTAQSGCFTVKDQAHRRKGTKQASQSNGPVVPSGLLHQCKFGSCEPIQCGSNVNSKAILLLETKDNVAKPDTFTVTLATPINHSVVHQACPSPH